MSFVTGGGFDTNAVLLDKYAVLGISLGIIIICACINSCSVKVVAGVLAFSGVVQVRAVTWRCGLKEVL